MGTLVFIVTAGAIAFWAQSKEQSFGQWFNGDHSLESVLVGMVYGLLFGFIDSILLLIGVEGLGSVYEKLPGGKSNTMVALYGNTYSSVISGFGSTFVGDIISSRVKVHKGPIWGQPVGLFAGCLIVILGRIAFGGRHREHSEHSAAGK